MTGDDNNNIINSDIKLFNNNIIWTTNVHIIKVQKYLFML